MPPKRKGRERVQCMTCQAVINGDEQASHKRRIHQNSPAVKFRIYMEFSTYQNLINLIKKFNKNLLIEGGFPPLVNVFHRQDIFRLKPSGKNTLFVQKYWSQMYHQNSIQIKKQATKFNMQKPNQQIMCKH